MSLTLIIMKGKRQKRNWVIRQTSFPDPILKTKGSAKEKKSSSFRKLKGKLINIET